MKLLNVGCGGQRPQDATWINLDELRKHLDVGTPERTNLDKEHNYVEHTLLAGPMPFQDIFDGVLIQHVVEHFNCFDAVTVLEDCRRVLKPGGLLVVSVPDASYFLSVYEKDTRDRAIELFGESISGAWQDSHYTRFFDYALFHREHKQLLTFDSLRCLVLKAGFTLDGFKVAIGQDRSRQAVVDALRSQLNRLKFSTILWCAK